MKPYRTALILAATVGLAACEGENKGADQRTAVGEILPGSVSDAMPPYDSLRSQPPLAPNTGSAGTGRSKGEEGSGDTPDATASDGVGEGDAAAPAEPAGVPTPETKAE